MPGLSTVYNINPKAKHTRPNTLRTSPYHAVPIASHSVMHTVFKRVGGPNQIVCAITYLLDIVR